jgi:ribose transport system permease protein
MNNNFLNINAEEKKRNNFFSDLFKGNNTFISIILLALVLFALFSFFVPNFFSIRNLINLSRRSSVDIIIAVGMTLVLLCGEIDLSLPGIISFVAMVTALMLKAGTPIIICVIAALAMGVTIGFLNGLLAIKIPSFIGTLAILSITRGMSLYFTNGSAVHAFPEKFLLIDRFTIFHIPITWVYAVIILIVALIITRYSVFGRQIYALGGNRNAARSSGVPISTRIIQTFMIMGFLGALGSIALMAKVDAATPLMSQDASLNAIAAVVIGGTSITGGKGHVIGSAAGALIITMLSNVFTLMSFPASLQQVILGVILIIVILIDYFRASRSSN